MATRWCSVHLCEAVRWCRSSSLACMWTTMFLVTTDRPYRPCPWSQFAKLTKVQGLVYFALVCWELSGVSKGIEWEQGSLTMAKENPSLRSWCQWTLGAIVTSSFFLGCIDSQSTAYCSALKAQRNPVHQSKECLSFHHNLTYHLPSTTSSDGARQKGVTEDDDILNIPLAYIQIPAAPGHHSLNASPDPLSHLTSECPH